MNLTFSSSYIPQNHPHIHSHVHLNTETRTFSSFSWSLPASRRHNKRMFCLKRGLFVLFFWLRNDKQDICFDLFFEMFLVFFDLISAVWEALNSGVNVQAKTFTLASLREIWVGNLGLCSLWFLKINLEVWQVITGTCSGWKKSLNLLRIANDVFRFRLRIRCVCFGCHSFHLLHLYVLTFVWLFVFSPFFFCCYCPIVCWLPVAAELQSHFLSSGLDPPCVMHVRPLAVFSSRPELVWSFWVVSGLLKVLCCAHV